jgi:hypothetical protein
MATSFKNGHKIYYKDDEWKYSDNDESISIKRSCVSCGKYETSEGHDACIANLPGVRNACCGHGVEKGYIQFEDGRVLRGYFEIK